VVCFILNIASFYRKGIFKAIDENLNAHFYFGDHVKTPIKTLDVSVINGFQKVLKNQYVFKEFYYQKGVFSCLKKEYKYYIMTGNPYAISNWIVLVYCKLYKKKSYLWSHGWYGKENRLKVFIKTIYFKLATGIFLYGDYAKELMIEKGFKEETLIPIYNSLDYKKQLNIRKRLEPSNIIQNIFSNQYPTIIYVGRIQKFKKLDYILESMLLLQKEGFYCNLLLVGNELDDYLHDRKEIEELKGNVHFYGPCFDENTLGELIYNSDCCASPGEIGLTGIHSLMFGCPVISHNDFPNQMPEFEVIQDGINGSFFIKDNIIDLTSKLKFWLSKENQRDLVRENCYKRIDSVYNPDNQIRIIKETLDL